MDTARNNLCKRVKQELGKLKKSKVQDIVKMKSLKLSTTKRMKSVPIYPFSPQLPNMSHSCPPLGGSNRGKLHMEISKQVDQPFQKSGWKSLGHNPSSYNLDTTYINKATDFIGPNSSLVDSHQSYSSLKDKCASVIKELLDLKQTPIINFLPRYGPTKNQISTSKHSKMLYKWNDDQRN